MIGRRSHDDAQSFEEAWNAGAPRDEHIADLVHFVEGLCQAAVAEPAPEFRESLRARLMTEASTVLVPMTRPPRPAGSRTNHTGGTSSHSLRRRMAGLTAAAVASVGVIGLVASSASAVPGEMLYPIKRGVESVELALHRDDASRGSFQLEQASERLAEARKLSDNGSGASDGLVAGTLDRFTTQAEAGSAALFNDFSDSGTQKSVRTVNDFAAEATAGLSTLSGGLPADASQSFNSAAKTISDLAIRASSLCSTCAGTNNLQSLVNAVTRLAQSPPVSDQAKPRSTKNSDKAAVKKPGGAPAKSGSLTPRITPNLPSPPAVISTPPTNEPRDSVLGDLLGTGDSPAVVPRLIDGLLSTQK